MDLLAHFCVHLLETLFFLGLFGSLGVVVLSLLQDLREFLHKPKDEPA